MVKLDSKEDRDVVLYSGPHLFFAKAMINNGLQILVLTTKF